MVLRHAPGGTSLPHGSGGLDGSFLFVKGRFGLQKPCKKKRLGKLF